MVDIAQLGIEIDSRQVKNADKDLDNLEKQAKETERATDDLKESFAALAAGATAVSAAIVASTLATAHQYKDLRMLAQIAGDSVENLYNLSIATKSVGVEVDELADIAKDAREKIGEFIETGGGPMKDFFELVAPKIGLTADALKNLSGTEILVAVKKAMDDANVSMESQVFYLETLASNSTKLAPLLENNGAKMRAMADEARALNLVLSDLEVARLDEMSKSVNELTLSFGAMADKLGAHVAPMIKDGADMLVWMLNNAVKPLAAGMEMLGATAADSMAIAGVFWDVVTSPSQWNEAGFLAAENRIKQLGMVYDEEIDRIAAKWAGLGGGTDNQIKVPMRGSPYKSPAQSAKDGKSAVAKSAQDNFETFGFIVEGELDDFRKFAEQYNKEQDAFYAQQQQRADRHAKVLRDTFKDDYSAGIMTDMQEVWQDYLDVWGGNVEAAGEAFVKVYGEKVEEATEITKTFGDELAGALQGPLAQWLQDFDDGLNGLEDAFKATLKRMAAEWAASKIMEFSGFGSGSNTSAGQAGRAEVSGGFDFIKQIGNWIGLSSGLGGGTQAPAPVTDLSTVGTWNFEGGGRTPNIPRVGGVDGRGGFWAVMHGNETVTDHTKGQRLAPQNNITINISGSQSQEEGRRTALQVGREVEAALARSARRNG